MTDLPDFRKVLAAYGEEFQPRTVEALGWAGGFSGALFWRLEAPRGKLCLRRWPAEHPSEPQLQWIHEVLCHVGHAGFHELPLPYPALDNKRHVRHGGYLWELTPWMPGRADYHQRPTDLRLQAAMANLAHFHMAAASFPASRPDRGPSPGIAERRRQVACWISGDLAALAESVDSIAWPEMTERARRILTLVPPLLADVRVLLEGCGDCEVPLQPCIRDIWHENVLLEGDQVTALVDFGAMGWENVAADAARLLGSMAGNDTRRWRMGLAAYEAVRPLSPAELLLVKTLDMSTAVMSGPTWIDWICRQHRTFENRQAVLHRLDEILARLEGMLVS